MRQEDYYSKEFVCGESSITRGELESLPCPFCTDDATDEIMQRIIDNTEFERLAALREVSRDNFCSNEDYKDFLDGLWWKDLENLVVAAGIPYYENL